MTRGEEGGSVQEEEAEKEAGIPPPQSKKKQTEGKKGESVLFQRTRKVTAGCFRWRRKGTDRGPCLTIGDCTKMHRRENDARKRRHADELSSVENERNGDARAEGMRQKRRSKTGGDWRIPVGTATRFVRGKA